jgi:glucose/arabinose dehydrogenase
MNSKHVATPSGRTSTMKRMTLCAAILGLLLGGSGPARADVYAVDWDRNSVLRYDGTGKLLGTFASGGGLSHYSGITFGPDGNMFVTTNPYPFNSGGGVLRFNGSTGAFLGTFVPAGSGGLNNSLEPTFGPDGNLYVAGFGAGILRYNGQTGAFIDNFVPQGRGGLVAAEQGIFGPDGNLYVADNDGSQVLRYNGKTGTFIDAFVSAGRGGLFGPGGLAFGPDGNLYVDSDPLHGVGGVLRYDGKTGAFIDAFVPAGSGGLARLGGIAFAPDGNLYVSSFYTNEGIYRYNGQTGAFIDLFAQPPPGESTGFTYFAFSGSSVPEPSVLRLLGTGAVCLVGWYAWRRRQRAV